MCCLTTFVKLSIRALILCVSQVMNKGLPCACCRCACGLNVALIVLFFFLTTFNFLAAGGQTNTTCEKVCMTQPVSASLSVFLLLCGTLVSLVGWLRPVMFFVFFTWPADFCLLFTAALAGLHWCPIVSLSARLQVIAVLLPLVCPHSC